MKSRFWGAVCACILTFITLPAQAAHSTLLGINFSNGDLYDVSTTDGSLSVIGSTGITFLAGLADNGTLHGVTAGSDASLYTIDATTAAATKVGTTGLSAIFEGALAFDSSGTLWMASGQAGGADARIYTVDTATGAATLQGTLAGRVDVNGLAFRSDATLVGIESKLFAPGVFFSIDLTTFATTDIASFGFNIGGGNGLAAVGDTGYMATSASTAPGGGTNSLYELDLLTGSTSLIGSFGSTITSGTGITGLAVRAVPIPAAAWLFSSGLLGLIGVAKKRKRA